MTENAAASEGPPPAPPEIARRVQLKHLRAIRWMHWINFPLLALMIWSGLLIYWAYGPFRIGVGDFTLVRFFPQWFYKALGLQFHLALGMAWHFYLMWVFAINGLAYVTYTVVSGEWRFLVPNRHSFREALDVVLFDLGLRKEPLPVRKYNAAQQIAYTGVVLMGGGSLITGLAIWKSVQFGWLTAMLGGYEAARLEHFLLAMGYVLFFLIHIAQVIRAGWNNFRGMVTGYEMVTVETEDGRETAAEA